MSLETSLRTEWIASDEKLPRNTPAGIALHLAFRETKTRCYSLTIHVFHSLHSKIQSTVDEGYTECYSSSWQNYKRHYFNWQEWLQKFASYLAFRRDETIHVMPSSYMQCSMIQYVLYAIQRMSYNYANISHIEIKKCVSNICYYRQQDREDYTPLL